MPAGTLLPAAGGSGRRYGSRVQRFVASPWRAVLLIALLIALPFVAAGQLVENAGRDRLRVEAQTQLDEGADLGAGIVAERIADVQKRVEVVASGVPLRRAVSAGDTAAMIEILADREPLFGEDVQRIFIVDTSGILLAIEPPAPETVGKSFAHRDYFTGATRTWSSYVSEAYQSAVQGSPAGVGVATPLRDESGRPTGLLVALVDLGHARGWLGALRTSFDDVYLLDQKGKIIFAESDARNASALRDVSADPAVSAMLAGARVRGAATDLLDGTTRIVADATVPRIGWHVVVGRSPELLEASMAEVSRQFRWLRLALVGVLLLAGYVLSRTTMRLLRATQRQALTDGLTGLYNRHHLERELRGVAALAERGGQEFSVVAMDLDGLKALNDDRGHAVGDMALQLAARALEESIRPYDTAVRTGGDEFVLILPQTNGHAATVIAARVLARLRERAGALAPPSIDGSLGVATWHRGMSAAAVLSLADARLYEAKSLGKGRVVSAPTPAAETASALSAI
ncbi:MAG: diguanylate cyclase [Candidatus Limnocylindria bacterium]